MPTTRIADFDTWRPGYGLAGVTVHRAGTTTPASIYSDEGLTVPLGNPQTLLEIVIDDLSHGKWAQPVYVAEPFEMTINSTDRTGVERPCLTTLDGINASRALVTPHGASVASALRDILARQVDVRDYGTWSPTDTATNTATLATAIGAVAGLGGGAVVIPAGTWPIGQVLLTDGVILVGQGRGVTSLLSLVAGRVVTLNGSRSGLARITLDGSSVIAGSTGLYSRAINETILHEVEVKRFDTGVQRQGGRRNFWRDVFLDNCNTGAKLHGDADASGTGLGDEQRDNQWQGGRVTNCTTTGISLEYVDRQCAHNLVAAVGFENNTGNALHILGARQTRIDGCWWEGNTVNLKAEDDSPAATENTIAGLRVVGSRMKGGQLLLEDSLVDVVFERVEFADVDITLTLPANNVLALDCTEDTAVTLSGITTAWTRARSVRAGATVGNTADATVTKAWGITLQPGQVVYAEAKVIGNQSNGTNSGEYHIAVSAERAPATLAYDAQSANFTLGQRVTGQNSGASALVVADADAGATGTLSLRSIIGTFLDNEIITDPLGGSAMVNGSISSPTVALLGAVAALRAAREDVAGWDATFVASGPELQVTVLGAAATAIEWYVDVAVTSA